MLTEIQHDIFGILIVDLRESTGNIFHPGRFDGAAIIQGFKFQAIRKPLNRGKVLIPERRSMYGPLSQQALLDITDSAEQYKIDGAIYWAFMGCRHTCATIRIVKELLNEVDVPMLTVDCDIVDPTINSEEEINDKLEQFFEMLEDR